MSYDDYDDEAETAADQNGAGVTITIPSATLDRIVNSAAIAIAGLAESKLDKLLAKRMNELFSATFEAQIGAVAEAAVREWLSKPRRKTNSFGEATGAETTLTESVVDHANKWLTAFVRPDGSESSYRQDNMVPRWQWLASSLVQAEVKAAAEGAAKKVSEEAKRVVAASVGRYIADQLTPKVELPKIEGR